MRVHRLSPLDYVLLDSNILGPYTYGPPLPTDSVAVQRTKLSAADYAKIGQLLRFVRQKQLITTQLLEIEAISGMRRQIREEESTLHRTQGAARAAKEARIARYQAQVALLEGIFGASQDQRISREVLDIAQGEVEKLAIGTLDALHVASVAFAKHRHTSGRGRSRQQRAAAAVMVTSETMQRGQRRRQQRRQQNTGDAVRPLYRTDKAVVVRPFQLIIPG